MTLFSLAVTGAEIQTNWFTPFHYIAYLGAIVVLMITYYQWAWSKTCEEKVKVIVVKSDGSTETYYAPKEGSSVAITNKDTGATKLWPITKLSTIDMLYPGDGFIPKFLQKKIRTTIVDEVDWEPLLNRGSYSEGVASPDVKIALIALAEALMDSKPKQQLLLLAEGLKTAPTREMIASPAILGNIGKEKVSELAVTIAKDIMHPLEEAIKRLGQQLKPMVVYIGLGLILILVVYTVFIVAKLDIGTMGSDIELIKKSLGIIAK